MKTKHFTRVLGIALIFLLSLPAAFAVPMLQLQSGATTVTVTDGDLLDSSPLPGVITYIGAVGNFTINVTTGITKPNMGDASSPQLDLNSVDTSTLGGQLNIRFSDNNYSVVPPGGFTGSVGGTIGTGGTATFKLYANSSNVPLDVAGGAVITHGPFGTGAFSGAGSGTKALTAPYSITVEGVIIHPASANGIATSFDYTICASNAIVCPPNRTVECLASVPPAAATVADFFGQGGVITSCRCTEVTLTHTEVQVGNACSGTITRTYRATDCFNNISTCVQVIQYGDFLPPVLSGCPANVTVECDAVPGAVLLTAADNCDPNPLVTFTETSVPGACPQARTITRTWTAKDVCNNSTSCVQRLTVVDTTPPEITCADP